MESIRSVADATTEAANQPWLPGMPHAVAALATAVPFGLAACISGLLLATLASFVVYLPLTAIMLNGGQGLAADAPAPALTNRLRWLLFALWTATAWASAALAAQM